MPVRKPQPVDHSILNEMIAIRLQQLELENGGMERLLPKTGLARQTYYQLLRGIGNPTLKTLERLASALNMTVFELLGFEVDDAESLAALDRVGPVVTGEDGGAVGGGGGRKWAGVHDRKA